MTEPATVHFPSTGVWRLGRGPDPLQWRRPEPVDTSQPGAGNRFDSFHGNYGVIYAATHIEACYAETLARFRPSPTLSDLVRQDWQTSNWMAVGSVPADWRNSRILVRIEAEQPLPFIDAGSSDTMESFSDDPRIGQWLQSFGVESLDLSHVIGHDRRVTRLLSQWTAEMRDDEDNFLYGGIRYVSRLGAEFECWAIFEGTKLETAERCSVLETDSDLCRVAERYHLTIH